MESRPWCIKVSLKPGAIQAMCVDQPGFEFVEARQGGPPSGGPPRHRDREWDQPFAAVNAAAPPTIGSLTVLLTVSSCSVAPGAGRMVYS